MFIFTQYAKIRDDEKQTHIGTQQDLNLVFFPIEIFHVFAKHLHWFSFKILLFEC